MNYAFQGRLPPVQLSAMVASPFSYYHHSGVESWLSYSGAMNHITSDLANLNFSEAYKGTDRVSIGNGQGLPISHTGNSSSILLHTNFL